MRITFVRHGQSMGNLTGDYSIDTHDQLSPLGLEQAQALADRLQHEHFHALYCSPLERAIQTLLPLAEQLDRPVEIWPEWAEACWQQPMPDDGSDSRYEPCPEIADSYGPRFRFRGDCARRSSDSETHAQGLRRLRQALTLVQERHGDDDAVLVVSHGHAITRCIELLLGLEPIGRFAQDNTARSTLTVIDGRVVQVDGINRVD